MSTTNNNAVVYGALQEVIVAKRAVHDVINGRRDSAGLAINQLSIAANRLNRDYTQEGEAAIFFAGPDCTLETVVGMIMAELFDHGEVPMATLRCDLSTDTVQAEVVNALRLEPGVIRTDADALDVLGDALHELRVLGAELDDALRDRLPFARSRLSSAREMAEAALTQLSKATVR